MSSNARRCQIEARYIDDSRTVEMDSRRVPEEERTRQQRAEPRAHFDRDFPPLYRFDQLWITAARPEQLDHRRVVHKVLQQSSK